MQKAEAGIGKRLARTVLMGLLCAAGAWGPRGECFGGEPEWVSDPLSFFDLTGEAGAEAMKTIEAAERVPLARWEQHGWQKLIAEPSSRPGAFAKLEETWPLGFSRADTAARVRFETHRPKLRVIGTLAPLGLAFDRELTAGRDGTVAIPFPAAVLSAGDYTLTIGVSTGGVFEAVELPVVVGPFLHYDRYHAYAWNSGGSSQQALENAMAINKRLNLDLLDFPFVPAVDALRQGLLMSAHEVTIHQGQIKDYAAQDHIVAMARDKGTAIGHMARRYSHLRWCLPNSEYGSAQANRYRNDLFSQAMQKEIGLSIADLRIGPALAALQTAPGIYSHDLPELKAAAFGWGEGGGWFRLNRITAEQIRKLAPWVKVWTDPLQAVEQFAHMDGISFWEYSTHPYSLLARIKDAECVSRQLGGRDIYVTTSQWFLGIQTGDKPGNVFRSPDQHRFYTWLIVSQGTDMLGYWALGQIGEQPDCADGLAAAMADVAYPYGTLLKGLPAATPPVAIYLSRAGDFLGAADRPHHYYFRYHYLNGIYQPLIEKFNNQVVRLDDGDILAGRHKDYPVLICPVFRATTDRLRDELLAYQKAGGHIVGDELWRADGLVPDDIFPGKNIGAYGLGYRNDTIAEWHSRNRAGILEWQPKAQDRLRFDFSTPSEDVILSHRERDGVQYYAALNARFEKGAWSERFNATDPRYRDVGKENDVTLSFEAPAGAAVYNAIRGALLAEKDYRRDGDRVELTTTLAPAGSALYVVQPQPLASLTLTAAPADSVRQGTVVSVTVTLKNQAGALAPGQTALVLKVSDPQGRPHDASGIFPLKAGVAVIPFGVGIEAPTGRWTVSARDLTSGLENQLAFQVIERGPVARVAAE